MEIRLLGPFEADGDGRRVPMSSRRQERCLLAILLLEAGSVVTTQRLVELLWDGQPPASARSTVHTYVGRLRRHLGPYGLRIATRHDGYLVDAEGHRLDTRDFVGLISQARDAPDPVERVRLYDRALELWRGPLLADVADEPLRARLGGTLTELRLSSSERRAEALLAMGRHDRVVADLMPLVEAYPTREDLVALLMTALFRASRNAEAHRLYDRTAEVLDRDLGVAPGQPLRVLRERILRGDPRLDRPAAPMYAVRVRDEWLPWNVGGHPALEFCNTFAGWRRPALPGSEWLREYATLAVWVGHVGLVGEPVVTRLLRLARRNPRQAAAVLDNARVLRANLYACLTDKDDEDAFAVVARFAEAAAKVSVFGRDDSGLGRWTLPLSAGLRLPLHAAAHSGAELLGDPRRYTVCACPAARCGWLFLTPDTRRTFCSLATCGPEAGGQGPAPTVDLAGARVVLRRRGTRTDLAHSSSTYPVDRRPS